MSLDIAPRVAPDRGVSVAHVTYALARRPRMSWQALAHQLGVNAISLKLACEADATAHQIVEAFQAIPRTQPRPLGRIPRKPLSTAARALLALAEGPRAIGRVCEAGFSVDRAVALVRRLECAGYVDEHLWLTPSGVLRVQRLHRRIARMDVAS